MLPWYGSGLVLFLSLPCSHAPCLFDVLDSDSITLLQTSVSHRTQMWSWQDYWWDIRAQGVYLTVSNMLHDKCSALVWALLATCQCHCSFVWNWQVVLMGAALAAGLTRSCLLFNLTFVSGSGRSGHSSNSVLLLRLSMAPEAGCSSDNCQPLSKHNSLHA